MDKCPRCGEPIGFHVLEMDEGICLDCILDDYDEEQNQMDEYFNDNPEI